MKHWKKSQIDILNVKLSTIILPKSMKYIQVKNESNLETICVDRFRNSVAHHYEPRGRLCECTWPDGG